MDRDEIQTLFAHLPREGRYAVRDHAMLLLLYNTGARVQEVADLRVEHVTLTSPAHVRLHGKGDKWRTCPLWDETYACYAICWINGGRRIQRRRCLPPAGAVR